MSEQRDNSGVLFKNDRKEQPNHPDMKGWGTINGVEVWISAWTKTGQKGKFLSLAIKPKDAKPAIVARVDRGRIEDIPDDLPF